MSSLTYNFDLQKDLDLRPTQWVWGIHCSSMSGAMHLPDSHEVMPRVYSTEERAKAYCDKMNARAQCSTYTYFKVPLDHDPES